jgi:glycerophosphoryl diester phosphodiesterase
MPAPPAKPWNVRDHIPLSQFVIQSHRGAGELAPENTIEAVREYYAKPRP